MRLKIKNKPKFLRSLLSFAIFLIGVIVGIAIRHYYKIPLAQEVNIVDIAMLITTVFLAVYVPAVLDRKIQTKRDEVQVIERRILEIHGLFRRINVLTQGESLSYEGCLSVNNLLDICSHQLGTIAVLIAYLDKDNTLKPEINEINNLFKKRHSLLFIEPVPQTGKKYSLEQRNQEESLYNQLDRLMSLLLFKVNGI